MWWPVTLILIAAPFVVYGGFWTERQYLLAAHQTELAHQAEACNEEVTKARAAGRADGQAEVRAEENRQTAATRKAIADAAEELAREPPGPPPEPPAPAAAPVAGCPVASPAADLVAACKRSASCRERRTLK